jgi:hypothetical protein
LPVLRDNSPPCGQDEEQRWPEQRLQNNRRVYKNTTALYWSPYGTKIV